MSEKIDVREIYSIPDCTKIVDEILKEELGLGENVRESILKCVQREFRYINWIRFKNANCPGCVSSPSECDIACGRGQYHGSWAKIVNGKIQKCLARINGTMSFNSEEGMQDIDIAEHTFNPVDILEPVRERN